jgi:hypothetical protein
MACSWLGSRTPRKVSTASGESQMTRYLPAGQQDERDGSEA